METKIKDILETLTPEERELHKDLIDECLMRELQTIQQSEKTKNNLNKLCNNLNNIVDNIQYISNVVENANNTLTLLSLSDDKFFNA